MQLFSTLLPCTCPTSLSEKHITSCVRGLRSTYLLLPLLLFFAALLEVDDTQASGHWLFGFTALLCDHRTTMQKQWVAALAGLQAVGQKAITCEDARRQLGFSNEDLRFDGEP